MFRFFKRLLLAVVFLLALALVASWLLPDSYEHQSSIVVNASKTEVYRHAANLESWYLIAMYGDIPVGFGLDDLYRTGKEPAVDSLVVSVRRGAEGLKVRCRIVRREEPDLIGYEASGGPVQGLKGEIVLVRDGESTRVTLKETLQFEGFFGSLKALAAKHAGSKLQMESLKNLKTRCELTSDMPK